LADEQDPVVVFVDRDGVINRDRPDYVKSTNELELLPGAAQAIARLKAAEIWVFVASNQAAVGKGLLSLQILGSISQSIAEEVNRYGGTIDSFLYCPHTDDDNCDCRKPRIGLFERGLSAFAKRPSRIFVVGDSARDMEAGHRIGAITILVLSGKTNREQAQTMEPKPDHIAQTLADAAEHIIAICGLTLK